MSPYLQAAAVYEREPCARSFEEDLFLHLMHGVVLSTPEVFMMARGAWSYWSEDELKDPTRTDPDGDTWYVWLLAGDGRKGWPMLTPKKWLAGERANAIRFRDYERLRRLYASDAMPAA